MRVVGEEIEGPLMERGGASQLSSVVQIVVNVVIYYIKSLFHVRNYVERKQ